MECSHCGRRAQLPLCNHCIDSFDSHLADLVWLLGELAVTASRQDRLTAGISQLVEHPSPANMGAIELMRSVGVQLTMITQLELEPRLQAWWLRQHLFQVVRRQDAAMCYRTIEGLVGRSGQGPIHDVINRPDRRFAGSCPECQSLVYGKTDDVYAVCSCGNPVDIERNRARTIADHDLLPEKLLLTTLDNLDEHLPRVTFYAWVKSGKLPAAGYLGPGGIVARRAGRHDPRVYSLSRARNLRRRLAPIP